MHTAREHKKAIPLCHLKMILKPRNYPTCEVIMQLWRNWKVGSPIVRCFLAVCLKKYCLAVLSKRQNPKCAMSLAYGMNTACYLHIRCDKYVYGSTPQDARQNRQRVDKCIGMQCTHCTHDNSASLKKSSMSMICVCVCSHVWACMCTCVWRPEVDVSCLPQSLPTLFF